MVQNEIINNYKLDFIGIGAAKSATTWIYECLREHPEIFVLPKEGQIFTNDNFQEIINHFFAKKQSKTKIRGDFSIWYLEPGIVSTAAENIKEHNPNIKIIASLRNPIERAYSQYFQYIYDNHQHPIKSVSFEEAIKKFSDKILDTGFYYKSLKKYFELFPKDNILILLYREIKQKPEESIEKIYRFLGVSTNFKPSTLKQYVGSTKFKQSSFHRAIYQISKPVTKTKIGQKIKNSLLLRRIYYNFADAYLKLFSPFVPSMKPSTREYLQGVFAQDIKKLEQLINRDLSFWN